MTTKQVLVAPFILIITFLAFIGLGEVLGPKEVKLPPCHDQNDKNCYWDSTIGNRNGPSFVRYDGVTIYYKNE